MGNPISNKLRVTLTYHSRNIFLQCTTFVELCLQQTIELKEKLHLIIQNFVILMQFGGVKIFGRKYQKAPRYVILRPVLPYARLSITALCR